MLRDLLSGCWASIRETLPDSVEQCGFGMGGFCWAFVLHWLVLIAVTWMTCSARGGC